MKLPLDIQNLLNRFGFWENELSNCGETRIENYVILKFDCVMHIMLSVDIMAVPSKFGAIRNSGYFSFFSVSLFGEMLELPFSAELKTTCLHLNMVYKMYLSCNFE